MTKAMLVALALAGGCSWGAQGYRAARSQPCSGSRVAPIADTALAVAGVGAIGAGLSQGLADEPGSNRSTVVGGGALGAIVFGAAAISGYTWDADCRRAPREPVLAAHR